MEEVTQSRLIQSALPQSRVTYDAELQACGQITKSMDFRHVTANYQGTRSLSYSV